VPRAVETDYSYSDLVTTIKTKTTERFLNPAYERDDQEVKNSLGKMMSVSNATNIRARRRPRATPRLGWHPVTVTAADTTASIGL